MRIKPWVVTGVGALCAGAAVAVIVATNDPYAAPATIKALFWIALGLGLWGVMISALLLAHMHLSVALRIGAVIAGGMLAVLGLVRSGHQDQRLLGGVIFATLVVSFWLWHRFRT